VWAVGDGAVGTEEAKAVVRDLIAPTGPDRFLYLGDVYEDGTAEEFERNYRPVYGTLDPITWPAIGDHEWAARDEGYHPYWERARGGPIPDFYAQRLGGWEILVLTTEGDHTPGSPQVAWLRRQVAEGGDCRIAVLHQPRWSAGDKEDAPDLDPLVGILRGRARLLLSGDDHNMQRLRPQGGLTQLIAGSGGREMDAVDRADDRLAFGDGERYGALRLDLRPGSVRATFVAVDGTELDRSDVTCRAPA
jgi:hypothetical protein